MPRELQVQGGTLDISQRKRPRRGEGYPELSMTGIRKCSSQGSELGRTETILGRAVDRGLKEDGS